VGVLVTAGLAGLLGYNPFVTGTVPVRRTYVSKHGYSPNYYHTSEYDNDGGQSEEVLFRQVLSGMPEESKYGIQSSNVGYPETQLYNTQDETYNKDNKESYQNEYDSYYNENQSGTSFVYPEKTATKDTYGYGSSPGYGVGQVEAVDNDKTTIEKQPEALYRVSDEDYNSEKNWHRIGSAASETYKRQLPTIEPGPRSLKVRRKRSVIQRIARKTNKGEVSSDKNELENDIYVLDPLGQNNDDKLDEVLSTTTKTSFTTEGAEGEGSEESEAQVVELTDIPHKVSYCIWLYSTGILKENHFKALLVSPSL
jgi:hypothetical protein